MHKPFLPTNYNHPKRTPFPRGTATPTTPSSSSPRLQERVVLKVLQIHNRRICVAGSWYLSGDYVCK